MPGRRLIIVLGPTAVGKTDFSIELALRHGSPVISCDSRQIYKEMTVGTAVPSAAQLAAVQHYFIQTHPVTCDYSAGLYEIEALSLLNRLFEEGHETLVMTGGSMFYIDAVCNSLDNVPTADPAVRAELHARLQEEGIEPLKSDLQRLDPAAYAAMDLSNSQRVLRALEICLATGQPYSSFKKSSSSPVRDFDIEKIGLTRSRGSLYERINSRVLNMMDNGLVDEVRGLAEYRDLTPLQTVGYKETFEYLDGHLSLDEAVDLIQRNTRHYARKQLTWWRRDPSIRWIEL